MNGPLLASELRLRRAPFHRPFCFLSRLLVRFAGITSGHFPTPSWMKGPGPRLADGSRVIAWKVPGSSQRVLTNDRSQTKNLFAKVSISFDFNLCPGRITINALCKNTPSQLLRYLYSRGELADRSAREIPSCRSSGQKP